MPPDRTSYGVPSVRQLLLRGVVWGLLAGAAAGALALPLVMLAVEGVDAALVILVLAQLSAVYGAVYGAVIGTFLAALLVPFRHNPDLVRRLRPVWAALAAVGVAALSALAFPEARHRGPGDSPAEWRETVAVFYAVPGALAALAAAALAPRGIGPAAPGSPM